MSLPFKRSRLNFIWLVWLIVPAILIWALRNTQLSEIGSTFRGLGAIQLLVLGVLNASIFLLISSRWWLILRTQGYKVPYFTLSGYRLLGFGITYFTPGPQFGGEAMEVYLLANRNQVPTHVALASVTMDKILDMMSNFVFMIVGVFIVLQAGFFAGMAPYETLPVTFFFFGTLLAYSVALWYGKKPFSWLISKLPLSFKWLKAIEKTIASAEQEITQFCREKPHGILKAVLLSAVIWAGMITEYWLVLHFLGLKLSFLQTLVAMVASRIAFLFPLPGGIGFLEASQMLAMQAMGLNPTQGLTISLFMRGRDILMGGTGLIWGGLLSRQRLEPSLPSPEAERPSEMD
ncbi:MAG: lysylphosphatidylglycerol synthase transmembrane domain-containing protein [Omnitrophica WOR_2 bacterium]